MMNIGVFVGAVFPRVFSSLLVSVFLLGLSGCGVDSVAPKKDSPGVVVTPSITISDARLTEDDSGTVNAVFAVTLSEATTVAVSVNYATADDSATTADGDYLAAADTLNFAPGETSQIISVSVYGDTNVEEDESFFVNLTNPVNATLADGQGVGTILNDDDVAVVIPHISISDASVTEGDSGTVNAVFNVTLSEATTVAVSVGYATADDSATTGGGDYVAAADTLNFAPGETSQTISVAVQGDTDVESNEIFLINLANAANATLLESQAAGTILNDDTAPVVPQISIADVSVTEGDSGTVNAIFTVTLSEATTVAVSVNYATADDSATTADSDYVAAADTLNFAPGEISQTISVAVQGDTKVEENESFLVDLANPVNATLADGQGVGTILNDDTAAPVVPQISIADVSVTEGDGGTVNAIFAVTLSEATTVAVSVNYATADDSATTGDGDYVAAAGTLNFAPGVISQTISVVVQGDTDVESNEIFLINLANPANATLADGQGAGTIFNDDTAPVVPQISIADVSVVEGNSGTVNAIFVVTLSEATTVAVSVDYATADDTATVADDDYLAAAGTLNFAPGVTSQTISVVVQGDLATEGTESFFVNLTAPVAATVDDSTAVGSIVNDDGIEFGLTARPDNPTCIASSRPQTSSNIQLESFADPDLTFSLPITMRQPPGDDSRWFIALKGGQIRSFENVVGVATDALVLDISSRVDSGPTEAGLLGMAFDPDFQTNGHVYVSYTAPGLTSTISRFTSTDGGQTLDPDSEAVLLTLRQPGINHNGGSIQFGPGPGTGKYLYIVFGDGGGAGDPDGNGQNVNTLLGSMLRIDVDVNATDWANGTRYYIPSDNPFASSTGCDSGNGCPEIFAWGLRNAWSWSFDRETNVLWAGDVGQRDWEEINRVELGGNYGWVIREGAHCYGGGTSCETAGLIDPVVEYPRSGGNCSVTGGYVYRGSTILGLQGQYLFSDFCSGRVWSFDVNDPNPVQDEILAATPYSIAGFAEGNDGELFLINYGPNGTIQRVVPAGGVPANPFPNKLSETGCVDPADPTQVVDALIPYMINAPFWTDGVEKSRYLSIPNNTNIQINSLNDWVFPVGSVLFKHFRINGALIETRLLVRHDDGAWGGYSYEWNDAGTDATFVFNEKEKVIDGQRWQYPSPGQCVACHTEVGGGPLGPETAQMNRDFYYPSTGVSANQLQTYDHIGLFDPPLTVSPASLPALVDTTDTTADLHARARAYLHTNCAQCHQPYGPTPANMDLRYTTADADMNICNVAPTGETLGIAGVQLVAPGDPDRSMLLERMTRRDTYGMPPLGSFIADAEGAALLRSWITAMGSTCP